MRHRRFQPNPHLCIATVLLGSALASPICFAQDQAKPSAPDAASAPAKLQPAAADKSDTKSELQRLRIVEDKGKSIALEIASRDYVRPDGTGPRVGLVAVAHIADRSFYRAVEKLLTRYDVVLYESVKPAGTGGAGGDTAKKRIDSTKAAMQFVGGLIETFHHDNDAYPANLDELRKFAAEKDARIVKFLNVALTDAWGHQLSYAKFANAPGETLPLDPDKPAPTTQTAEKLHTYSLVSFGADGKPGGDDENADLSLADQETPDALALSKEDGLQSQLASALGLEFQLDALPYDTANWRCSDMAMDEVNRRLAAKGIDFSLMGGTLAGTSLPAKLIKLLLGFMKMADNFTQGAITDTFKVVLIEVLGNPSALDSGLAQIGEGFGEVIVHDRNQVVIDDLKKVIESEPQVHSVAILYGAAHMPDMAERLHEQLGYEPAPDDEQTHWLTAIKVNLKDSKVSQEDLDMIRNMMKQAIRQQMRRR